MIKKIPEKKHIVFSIGILLLVSLVLFLHFRNANKEEVKFDFLEAELVQAGEVIPPALIEIETKVIVDIKGAVALPGVYELSEGSRMHDVIEMAGGFLSEADELQLNLAQLLQDEMMIYVPREGEEVQEEMAKSVARNEDGKIAINRVDEVVLEQLPGIGPAKAAAIISHREEHGPFKGIDDLQNVSGIGPKSAEQLADHIVFN
ncbi:helix-hairpin-helix domain-containing protein [Halalkalibacter lacteus]|uniref:helix-hairpin-helix domain-containing protein n=1 Tax=Halalkalibacter lacteus TaxID=3090663 RepID=UPI002FC9E2AE